MPVIQRLVQRNAPGVYVSEDTYGSVPALLADHGNVYVMGTCTAANFPYNTPVYISNYTDFLTQCISSPSAAAIKLFFAQRSGSGLYFIRVASRQQATLGAVNFTAGSVLSVTVAGGTVSYTCGAAETQQSALDALGTRINQQLAGIATYVRESPTVAYIRTPATAVVTASNTLALGAQTAAGNPRAYDVNDSIKLTFVPEHGQGYLCAPEFFQAYTSQSERTLLQLGMEALASDPRFYWVAVADFGQATASAFLSVNAAQTERATFVSPRGNSTVSYPYLIDDTNTIVPSSLAQIGVALRRARTEGFAQPPAGVNYPIYGVTGTTVNITSDMQEQLNPLGINCIRSLPARGIVMYGARTLSPSPFYQFLATRVILNVLAGTLRRSFDSVVFTLVDGQGVLFSRVAQTAANICERLRLAGALYGATPQEAYMVVCDSTNNTMDGLESGIVNLDVIAKPSPTLEALNVTMSRASLSTLLVEVVAAGDTAAVRR